MRLQFIAYITLVRYEIQRMIRIWPQTVIPPIISTCLYFLIFGHVIGRRVGLMAGYPYIQYITPGLIMMAFINNSYGAASFSFFGSKFSRSIEEMIISPMRPTTMLLGFISSGVMRAFVIGIVVAAVGIGFTKLHIYSWPKMLLVAFLSSVMFSLAGILNAVFAKRFDDISIIPTFVLSPLIYLGGVFYSIHLLSPFWYHISLFNPVYYLIEAFRHAVLGIAAHHFLPSLMFIILAIVLLYGICIFLLRDAERYRL